MAYKKILTTQKISIFEEKQNFFGKKLLAKIRFFVRSEISFWGHLEARQAFKQLIYRYLTHIYHSTCIKRDLNMYYVCPMPVRGNKPQWVEKWTKKKLILEGGLDKYCHFWGNCPILWGSIGHHGNWKFSKLPKMCLNDQKLVYSAISNESERFRAC